MPLNPNGKIDKPALPFPDTAQLASAHDTRREGEGPSATPTEEAMRAIWARVLPNAPNPIPLDENFFDLGGQNRARFAPGTNPERGLAYLARVVGPDQHCSLRALHKSHRMRCTRTVFSSGKCC